MPQPSRAIPAFLLLVTVVLFGWAYSDHMHGQPTMVGMLLVPPLGALALGGLVDPRILWSVGPRRKSLPRSIRIIGAALFGGGFLLSLLLMVLWPMS